MSPISASRIFTLFSKKVLHRPHGALLSEEDEEDIESISTVSTKSDAFSWYYCQDCKIAFNSLNRHDWHTDLCKNKQEKHYL
ncbi:hypothetical protein HPULCUR_002404 [Helicostylum pulchrum]|uniref:C2H2-type domain-containing protein n=1 Tax=Helicostylum pulchrum TaxID=562976 RepID=A0ABP9XQH6_9FUNG